MVLPRHAFINNDAREFGIVYTDYILTIDGNFAMMNFITWIRHNHVHVISFFNSQR